MLLICVNLCLPVAIGSGRQPVYRMSIEKFFLAIVLPSPQQEEVMKLKEYVRAHFESKAALRSPAHITLHMPFEWKDSKEDILLQALQDFKFGSPVQVELKNFNCFEPRVVYVDVVPNDLLVKLQKELVQHVKSKLGLMNEAENTRGFHPHATIAFRDLNKEHFRRAWAHFKGQKYEASFTVSEFHLLKHSPGKWDVYKTFNFA